MDLKKEYKKLRETLLLISGFLLVLISFIFFHFDKILEINNQIKNEIESEIYKENTSINSNISVNVNVDYIENNEIDNNDNNISTNTNYNYIGFLEIEKINFKQGFLKIDSPYNKVNYNIEVLSISNFPDVINGNFIIAGHSGTSSVAFFKNLYKLKIEDIAKVYYNGKIYKYKITNIYNQVKDGSINIYKSKDTTTLTLITCTKNDKNSQTVYIFDLIGVESY